jgi:hypothetical protein
MTNDGGNLILNTNEKEQLINKYPILGNKIRKFIGSQEFLR